MKLKMFEILDVEGEAGELAEFVGEVLRKMNDVLPKKQEAKKEEKPEEDKMEHVYYVVPRMLAAAALESILKRAVERNEDE